MYEYTESSSVFTHISPFFCTLLLFVFFRVCRSCSCSCSFLLFSVCLHILCLVFCLFLVSPLLLLCCGPFRFSVWVYLTFRFKLYPSIPQCSRVVCLHFPTFPVVVCLCFLLRSIFFVLCFFLFCVFCVVLVSFVCRISCTSILATVGYSIHPRAVFFSVRCVSIGCLLSNIITSHVLLVVLLLYYTKKCFLLFVCFLVFFLSRTILSCMMCPVCLWPLNRFILA